MQRHGVHLLPQRSVRLGGKLGVRWEQDKKGQTKTFGICLVPALFCDLALPSHDCARWEQGRDGANKNFRNLSRSSPRDAYASVCACSGVHYACTFTAVLLPPPPRLADKLLCETRLPTGTNMLVAMAAHILHRWLSACLLVLVSGHGCCPRVRHSWLMETSLGKDVCWYWFGFARWLVFRCSID